MDDQKRGKDASDRTAMSERDSKQKSQTGTQDAPNPNEFTDDGKAVKREDLSSANDE